MSTDNPLLTAAAPLMNTIVQIRLAATHDDPAGLRQQLVDEVRQFENRCRQAGIPFEMIIGTRYCLCSALDEAASQTPWGSRGIWSGNGLLVTFHNESWGGEKFFQLLSRLSQTPQQHLWLLEVLHYCLLLGYEGRYRTQEHGRTQRDAVRTRLAKLIEETRGTPPQSLAPKIADHPRQSPLWRPPVPLWVCLTITAFVAGVIYSGFNWRLSEQAAPLLSRLYQIPLPADSVMTRHASSQQPLVDLRKRLSDLISDRQLNVIDGNDGSQVIINASALFEDGSTSLTSAGRVLVSRIAVAMDTLRGTILVTAWADNKGDGRFPTSYEYTLAQARTVSGILQQVMTQNSHIVRAEGRGNVAPSGDDQSSNKNSSRIEITLYPSPENESSQPAGRAP